MPRRPIEKPGVLDDDIFGEDESPRKNRLRNKLITLSTVVTILGGLYLSPVRDWARGIIGVSNAGEPPIPLRATPTPRQTAVLDDAFKATDIAKVLEEIDPKLELWSATATLTPKPTKTAQAPAIATDTSTQEQTGTPTGTATEESTPTPTLETSTATATPTPEPTATSTLTKTAKPTATATETPIETLEPTATPTPELPIPFDVTAAPGWLHAVFKFGTDEYTRVLITYGSGSYSEDIKIFYLSLNEENGIELIHGVYLRVESGADGSGQLVFTDGEGNKFAFSPEEINKFDLYGAPSDLELKISAAGRPDFHGAIELTK